MAFQSDDSTGYALVDSAPAAAPAVPASPATQPPAATGCCDCDPGKPCDCCGPGTNPWDGTVKAGFGLRSSMNYVSETNGAVSNTYNYFSPDDARIYLSGSAFGGKVKGTLNTEISGDGLFGSGSFVAPDNVTTVNLLDGIAQFEFSDYLNFWAGRFLPPTDRSTLDGPFYLTPYDFPFVSNYPSLLAGRDDGFAYWGQYCGGKLKWQLGMFNGIGRDYDFFGNSVGANATGNYSYTGRVTINLLDPEPGYYPQSCYFGEKEILAIGISGTVQHDGTGTEAIPGISTFAPADFNAGNIDFLWEHKFGNCGVIDIEGAFYRYDYGSNTKNTACVANQGTSEFVQMSYLLPQSIGICGVTGKLQPFTRYQYYCRDFRGQAVADGLSTVGNPLLFEGVDVGVNYVISGYNARTTVAWEQRDAEGGITYSIVRACVQLQF